MKNESIRTRIGKIARIPHDIREELNKRLADGVPGKQLVVWLNELREVRRVLAEQFGGAPINEQNLSNWKQGGYLEWMGRRELMAGAGMNLCDASVDSPETKTDEGSQNDLGKARWTSTQGHGFAVSESMAAMIAAQYASALMELGKQGADLHWLRRFRSLRTLSAEVAELRRSNHRVASWELESERRQWESRQIKVNQGGNFSWPGTELSPEAQGGT